jgi:hypothetical protein
VKEETNDEFKSLSCSYFLGLQALHQDGELLLASGYTPAILN